MKWHLLIACTVAGAGFSSVSCGGKKKNVVPIDRSTMVAGETGVALTDEHFRFSIKGLDAKWQLLDKERKMSILPDAAAVAQRIGGGYGAVVVEPFENADLQSYSDLMQTNYEGMLVDFKADEERKTEFHGIPAIQRSATGKLNGIELDYEIILFLREGLGYQILAWEPRKEADRSNLMAFIGAVSLDEGALSFPPPDPLPDGSGIGNRVVKNRYESAVSRLAAAPTGQWGLLWGAGMIATGEDAEIGLVRPEQGIYLTVTSEPITEEHRERFLSSATAGLVEGAQHKETKRSEFGGESFELTRASVSGDTPIDVYLGNVVRGQLGYRVKAWHLRRKEGERFDSIQEGLKAFSFLDDAAVDSLRKELVSSPDTYGAVGEKFSVRGGVFRDFGTGVVWKRPAGFWKFQVGDEALAQNEEISLQAVEIETGFKTQLLTETLSVDDPEAYHQAARSILEKGGFTPLEKKLPSVVVDGIPVLRSCFVFEAVDDTLEYHLATAVKDGRGYQMNSFAKPEVMKAYPQLSEETLAGYSFPGDTLKATKTAGGRFHDLRMGFQLSLSGGPWTIKEEPHPVISKMGNIVSFRGQSAVVNHFAIQADGAGNDASKASKMMENLFRVNLDRASSEGSQSRSETVAGRPATIRSGASGGNYMHFILFDVGGVAHFAVVESKSEKTADKLLQDYIAGISLVP